MSPILLYSGNGWDTRRPTGVPEERVWHASDIPEEPPNVRDKYEDSDAEGS